MKNLPVKFFCVALLLVLANGGQLGAQTNTNAVVTSATNPPVVVSLQAATNVKVVLPSKPRPATLIESDGPADFDLTGRRVIYHDHVRVDSPEMKLSCEWLAADLPQDGGRVTNIVAETNVVIDATDDKGQKMHAAGDKAVYVFALQNGATNETVTLTGSARVENAQGWLTGDLIIWDRAHNHLSVPANPKMIVRENFGGTTAGTNSPPATTNQLTAPK
jgi:lipopolysaccharide export system protein LptA